MMRMFVKMPVSQVCFLETLLCTREIHRVFPKGAIAMVHKEDAEQDELTSAKVFVCAKSLHWQPLCIRYVKMQSS